MWELIARKTSGARHRDRPSERILESAARGRSRCTRYDFARNDPTAMLLEANSCACTTISASAIYRVVDCTMSPCCVTVESLPTTMRPSAVMRPRPDLTLRGWTPGPVERRIAGYAHCSVLRNAIVPLSTFHGFCGLEPVGLQLAIALALVSRSTQCRYRHWVNNAAFQTIPRWCPKRLETLAVCPRISA